MRCNTNGDSVFPIVSSLPEEIKGLLDEDVNYCSNTAKNYDLSWQAYKRGFLDKAEFYKTFEKLSIQDEYNFIAKYYKKHWLIYILVLRLLSFKNPITEIKAFLKSQKVNSISLYKVPFHSNIPNNFKSQFLNEPPLISVVIPTLNRYDYLKNVLRDFEKQTYHNFEIIIVDQSDDFTKEFYDDFSLKINLIHQEEKALWLARNTAIKASKGSLLAFSEDDVRINPDWLSQHLKCLDYFNADISAGLFFPENTSIPKDKDFYAIAEQFATGNAMLSKDIFKTVGLFDRQFEKGRMGDGAFGMRCFLEGYKSVSNPKAYCLDVKAPLGGLREFGAWDAFRTQNWFAPRPMPSVLYYFRFYFGNTLSKLALLKTIPASVLPYKLKRNKILSILGAFLAILIAPILIYQILKSWNLATRKLKIGPKIEHL